MLSILLVLNNPLFGTPRFKVLGGVKSIISYPDANTITENSVTSYGLASGYDDLHIPTGYGFLLTLICKPVDSTNPYPILQVFFHRSANSIKWRTCSRQGEWSVWLG